MKNLKNFVFAICFAVCIGFGFGSCMNHDFDFDQSAYADAVTKYYQEMFVKTFGDVAPEQTWGFGNVATARAFTRAVENPGGYEFPNDADASKFLAEVPAGVSKLTQNNASVNGWIDETWSGELNVWGQYDPSIPPYGGAKGGILYVKGNCDFSNRKFYFAGHSELYLIAGATLTLNAENAANLQESTMIYVAEGAKIVTDGELVLNKGLHIYNHGTIEANKISTNSNSVLYNVGTITVDGKISVENDLSVFVNDGELTAAELNTAGSGKVQNNGIATIAGTTTINSNSNTWVNNGQYQTEDFKYTAGSSDVKNNCRLTVTNEFYINLGDCEYGTGFYVDGGVVAGSLNMGGPGYIYLGSNSVFNVEGTATMNITKAKYGIYGIGTEWAVFQANEIVAGAANQEYLVTYGGKLAVITNSHFAQATEGRPYYDVIDEAVLSTEANVPEINIPETECNPGFTNKSTEPTEPTEKFVCRIFGEDLTINSGSDFDFNDVVFDVIEVGDWYRIEVLAAGGMLELKVEGQEIHALFGEGNYQNGKFPMINTQPGKHNEKQAVPFIIAKKDPKDIKITVLKENVEVELTAVPGMAAAKFATNERIDWCDERENIDGRYDGKFGEWVRTASNVQWWK